MFFFSDDKIGRQIVNSILSKKKSPIIKSSDPVDFNDEIMENINHWSILKEQLKWEHRYLTDINHLTDDLGWDSFFESKTTINKDNTFYRARLHNSTNSNPFSKDEMVCPTKESTSAGRANPAGIPYLYLSEDEDTTLYEIRALFLDEVSVASFHIKKDLSRDIVISDFTETPSLFTSDQVNKQIKLTLLK